MPSHRLIALALGLALPACEPAYTYVPVTDAYEASDRVDAASAGVDVTPGTAAATYPIPRDAPRGNLRIASYGLVDIGPQTQSDKRIVALHLRMTLTNDSDRPWTLDTREQRVALEGFGTSVAAFASADAGSAPPTITVPPKGKRVVDLFFPLPTQLQSQRTLPSFDALWRVQADDQVVSDETPFERMAVQPPATHDPTYDYGPDYYWGPPYWYNPYYADYGFVGGIAIPPFYFGFPLYVHQHAGYGHFVHHGYYYGGYPYYYRGYPYGGYYGGYPYGRYYRGYPYGGYYRGYPYGSYYRGYPYGGYRRSYPSGGYYRGGGHPPGGYPRPQGGYRGYPGGGHPGGYPGVRPGGGYPGGRPGGGYPGARPGGGYPGGHPGGGRPGGGGSRGGGHR